MSSQGIGPVVSFSNKVEAERGGERERNVEKNVLVMKCNKSTNIPYSGEWLSVKTG